MQLFCFLLKQFFETVIKKKKKKKSYGRGVLERVGQVTVNTTFFCRLNASNRLTFVYIQAKQFGKVQNLITLQMCR